MKIKKQARFLYILLTFVMLLGMLPMTALAATYITEVTVTGVQTPVVGQPCSVDTIVITTNPANAYITEGTGAVRIYWYDKTDHADMSQTDTFIDGHKYFLCVELEPKEGYAFGFKSHPSPFAQPLYTGTATLNGKEGEKAEMLIGSDTGLFVCNWGIVPKEEPQIPPATPEIGPQKPIPPATPEIGPQKPTQGMKPITKTLPKTGAAEALPKTGEQGLISLWFGIMAFASAGAFMIVRRRDKYEN